MLRKNKEQIYRVDRSICFFYVIIDNHIGGVFMKWKVGIYARVSRDSEYSDSIDTQFSLVRRYCINNNFDIVESNINVIYIYDNGKVEIK